MSSVGYEDDNYLASGQAVCDDSLIELNRARPVGVDIGLFASYQNSGLKYTGLFSDASDSFTWKLFTGESNPPTANVMQSITSFGNLSLNTIKLNAGNANEIVILDSNKNMTTTTSGVLLSDSYIRGLFSESNANLTYNNSTGVFGFVDSPTFTNETLTGALQCKGLATIGYDFGVSGGVKISTAAYGKPTVESLDSALGAETLYLNPAGGVIQTGSGGLLSRGILAIGYESGVNAGVRISRNTYAKPSVEALTSSAGAETLYVNPAGGSILMNGSGTVVGIGETAPHRKFVVRDTTSNPMVSLVYSGTAGTNSKELQLGYDGSSGSGYGFIRAAHLGTSLSTPLSLNEYGSGGVIVGAGLTVNSLSNTGSSITLVDVTTTSSYSSSVNFKSTYASLLQTDKITSSVYSGCQTTGGYLSFATAQRGTTSLLERMKIDEDGKIGIGGAPYRLFHLFDVTNTGSLFMQGSGTGSMEIVGWNGSTYNPLAIRSQSGTHLYLDTSGNVSVKTTTSNGTLTVSKGTQSAVPTLGTAAGALALHGDATSYGLFAGVVNTGNSWFQTMRSDGTGTAYSLLLNPSGGNVGVGESSPSFKCTVRDATTSAQLSLIYSGTAAANNKELQLGYNGASGNGYGWLQAVANGVAYTPLALQLNGGYVGIGTTNPQSIFHVSAATGATAIGILEDRSTGAADIQLQFRSQYASLANGSKICGSIISAPSNTGGRMIFYTAQNTTGTLTERMRIDDLGFTTIGSGDYGINFSTADSSTGFWIRNDGFNTVISTKKGSMYYGYGGASGISHLFYSGTGTPSETMRVGDGKVGIGVAPSFPLHVKNASSPQIVIDDNSGGTAELRHYNAGSIAATYFTNSTGTHLRSVASVPLYLGAANANYMTILASGYVGVGCTPAAKFQVSASVGNSTAYANYSFLAYDAGTATASYGIGVESFNLWFSSNSAFKWYSSGTQNASLDGSGNLTTVGTFTSDGGYRNVPYACVAEVYNSGSATQALVLAGAKLTIFDSTGISKNATPSASSDNITITVAGTYKVEFRSGILFSALSGGIGIISLVIQKNGSSVASSVQYISNHETNSTVLATSQCLVDCAVNDVLTIFGGSTPNQTITFSNPYLSVARVGTA